MKLLRLFFNLGVIIGPLPYQIVAGQAVSAAPVMADFNWIVSQVNANVASSGFPTNSSSIRTYVPATSVGGSANAITLTPTPVIAAYAEGQSFSFRALAPNTSAVTIATSGLATRALRYADGTAMTGRELLAGGLYDIEDNGTYYVLLNSAQGSGIQTWTPGLTFGGGSTGLTYSSRSGFYYKQGRLVTVSGTIVLSNQGSSTGANQITNLPFTVNASWGSTDIPLGGTVWTSRINTNGFLSMSLAVGGTVGTLVNTPQGAGAASVLVSTDFTNTSAITFTGSYIA